MLVYFPVKDENGWNVIMIPMEQLDLVVGKVIQRIPGKRGYVTDRYYDFNYMFKTSEAAWRFIRKEPVNKKQDMYSKVETWYYKDWPQYYLTKKERKELKKLYERENENDYNKN